MDIYTLKTLIGQGKSTTQLAILLNCSQTNIRYWMRKYGLNTLYNSKDKMCKSCGAALEGRQWDYCSKKCKGLDYSKNPNNYKNQQNRALDRKIFLAEQKGGKCERCGYDKNYAALCFHHKDPSDKLFGIDLRKCSNTNMESLIIESAKCTLLCHNCHVEIHHPQFVKNLVHPTRIELASYDL